MIEHLESAVALADETQDSTTSYLLERGADRKSFAAEKNVRMS
jgi:hypothetical protein